MRRLRLLLPLGFTLLLAACDGDSTAPSGPLEITSITPADGATAVETGATVEVVFNREIDPATLAPESFQVRQAGTPLPSGLSYDTATRTARAVVPLLPGAPYRVEVTTGVRTPDGAGLSAAEQWGFSTRSWEDTTVDAGGDVVRYTSLAVDGSGRFHVSYFDNTNADLKCATCGCLLRGRRELGDRGRGHGRERRVEHLGGGGRQRSPHVSYEDFTNDHLKYATCAASCATAASWETAAVDTDGLVGFYTSLAVDGSGRLHVSYWDNTNDDLKYASCAVSCAVAGNWETVAVDTDGRELGRYNSLAVDGSGRLLQPGRGGRLLVAGQVPAQQARQERREPVGRLQPLPGRRRAPIL